MAMTVIVLLFAINRIVVVVMAMLGTDPDFLRSLGLEPGDFTAFRFGSGQDLFVALCQWDCPWYETIWSVGYDVPPSMVLGLGQATWGFFPMFPVSVRVLSYVLPLSPMATAHVFNGVSFIATAWLLYLMARDHQGHRAGLIAASLFLCTPFGIHAAIPYTEALFNVLTITAFFTAYQKRWIATGLIMALLSATKSTGLLVAIPILVIAIRQVGLLQLFRVHVHTRIVLAFALCPLGLSLFMLYLHFLLGDALAFSHAQQVAWQNFTIENPFERIYNSISEPVGHFPWISRYNAIIAVVVLCMVVLLAFISRWPEAILLGTILLFSAAVANNVGSIPRYTLGIWPPYLLLGILLRNRPIVSLVLCSLLAFGLALFALAWVNWVGWL